MKKKRVTPKDSEAAYLGLESPLKAIVGILAVQVFDFRQKDVLACLSALGIQDKKGRPFTAPWGREAADTLAGMGLVTKKNTGLSCDPGLGPAVVKDLVLTGQFKAVASAVVSVMPFGEGVARMEAGKIQGFHRSFQIAVFGGLSPSEIESVWGYGTGRFAELAVSPPFTALVNQPFDPQLLDGLNLKTRAMVLALAVSEVMVYAVPCQELMAYAFAFFRDRTAMAREKNRIMEVLLLQGRFADHEALLPGIKGKNPVIYQCQKGCRHFLLDDNAKALACFNQALAQIKKKTRKRHVFFNGLHGFFFLLALLKTGEPMQFEAALTHIRACADNPVLFARLFTALSPLFYQGPTGHPTDSGSLDMIAFARHPLFLFFRLLIMFWQDPESAKSHVPELKQVQKALDGAGFLWGLAEASALLAALGSGPKRNPKKALSLHEQMGTTSVIGVVRHVPAWEKALNALIQMGNQGPDNAGIDKASDQRLIWLMIHKESSQSASIMPRLQKRNKAGQWTKGRAVALKKLYMDHQSMDWLTDQDRRVCNAIKAYSYASGYYGRYRQVAYEFDPDEALLALAGHPLIFLEGDLEAPVALVKGAPQVRLKQEKTRFRLAMDPVPLFDGQETAVVREAPARFRLVVFTKSHIEIAGLLGQQGLALPQKAVKIASKAVASLSSLVQVQSDLADQDRGEALEVAADPVPRIQVMPFHQGISMEAWVRPFGQFGSYFRPGRGGARVFAEKEGQQTTTARDLDLETDHVRRIEAACPTLEHLEPVEGQWLAQDPEQALELLSELKACNAQLEWPKGETLKLAATADFSSFAIEIKKERDWFKATGSLALSETQTLDLKALLPLLDKARGRFIPLDDTTFVRLTQGLKARLQELADFSQPHGKGLKITPLAAPAMEELTGLAGSLKTDKAWKDHCRHLKEANAPNLPSTLTAELRDYQKQGFSWLARLAQWQVGACLADDMGLGKTLQALSAILLLADKGPTLVVAPLSVMANWQEECQRFAPTLVPKLFGPGDRQAFLDGLGPFDLVVASYGLLQTEAEKLAGVSWQTVVLDEAQAIKNMKTKRSRAAMGLSAAFCLITTGTPVENHLDELWTLFNFINPGLLGPFSRFKERFALPIERDQSRDAARRLRKLIQPFILRRLKTDVLAELPEKTEVVLHVEMSQEEALLYEAQRLKALETIEGAKDAAPGQTHLRILAELTRLRRLCCNPALVLPDAGIPSSKLRVFSDTVAELLANRHKILVFSQFVGHLALIQAHLDAQKISYQYLDGATPAKERQKRIAAFQKGEGDLFLISLKAGGSGLNLTAADYVIHMDPWWNPAVEDQASDRAHRIGQTRPVTVYRLVVKDTIEEKILNLHAEKRELAQTLLSGSDAAGKISADELLNLLRSQG